VVTDRYPTDWGRLEDQTVVVTGSTRGIGASIADRFAAEGANIVITGRTAVDGDAIVVDIGDDGSEATFLRDPADIEALFQTAADRFGGVDALVNNAGVETNTAAADEATLDDWKFVLETDFRAYWLCAKHAVAQMDEGAIVNVSSNHAFLTMPEMFPYNAVKAGINGMTRGMALDFGPDVRVNTGNPGWVAIERTTEDMDEERREHLESIHPVGRLGGLEDVAGAVAFLASNDAAFITGVSLLVDGGRSAVMQDDTLPDYRTRRDG
jgi:glucose 1-dehydrogenase